VNGLPENAPVDTVREDLVQKNLLFAGTETSVWVSFDAGNHWESLQLNLPHTSMRDVWIHENDLIVGTHGRSFWILDDIEPLREMALSVEVGRPKSVRLFRPSSAYRVRRDTNTDTPLPADEPAGQNPPDGAIINYWIRQTISGPLTLEILDSQGKVIRGYSSTDQPERSPEELKKEMIPPYWLQPFRSLPTDPGLHRWVWDLRYPAPVSTSHEYPIAAVPHRTPRYPLGPLVVPGTYSVHLAVNGTSMTAPLTIKMDPRVKVSRADLQKKFDLSMRLYEAMNNSSKAVNQARSVHEQLDDLAASATAPLKDSLESLNGKITELLDGVKKAGGSEESETTLSGVNSDVIALYKQVEQSDAAPTVAQAEAFNAVNAKLSGRTREWDELKREQLPKVNEQLRSSGKSELRLDLPPREPEHAQNEE
jgi:hypothetical protein